LISVSLTRRPCCSRRWPILRLAPAFLLRNALMQIANPLQDAWISPSEANGFRGAILFAAHSLIS
jgi:hypothetical protein